MARNLKYQFLNAIEKNFNEGMDKHSLKRTEGLGSGRIFSYADRKNLIDFSCNFAKYIKENYSNVKLARDIKVEHIQAFLNSKATSCSKATLVQYKSKFNKLETLVNKTYGSKVNYSKGYVVPITKENTAKIRCAAMSKNDYSKLCNAMKDSKSSAVIAVQFAGRFGLRVSETTKLQGRDIDLQKGVLRVVDSKGKRSREISIPDKHRAFLQCVRASVGDTQRIVPIQPNSVNKAVRRGLEKAGSSSRLDNNYKDAKTGIHSIRKMAAQNHFNECRSAGLSIKDSLSSTSIFLGHGANRYELMKEYVENIK